MLTLPALWLLRLLSCFFKYKVAAGVNLVILLPSPTTPYMSMISLPLGALDSSTLDRAGVAFVGFHTQVDGAGLGGYIGNKPTRPPSGIGDMATKAKGQWLSSVEKQRGEVSRRPRAQRGTLYPHLVGTVRGHTWEGDEDDGFADGGQGA